MGSFDDPQESQEKRKRKAFLDGNNGMDPFDNPRESPQKRRALVDENSDMDSIDDPQEWPEKRKREAFVDENSGTDRISDLPLSVLSHILSFLPTEDAVATSLLSTQWKKFFPLICNLIVTFREDSFSRGSRSSTSFTDFVNHVLNVTFRDVDRIDTANFFCSQQMHYHDWIRALVRLKVQTLQIIIDPNFQPKSPVMLLHSLIDYKTLKNLTLGQDIVLDVREGGITFPCLRSLSLRWIEFVDENSIQRLLNGCPRLEYLTLNFALQQEGLKLHICLCSLRSLELSTLRQSNKIVLDTPKLESLKYCGYVDDIYLVKNLDILQRADIFFFLGKTGIEQCRTDLTKIFAACSNVNQLKLRMRHTHRLPLYYSHVLPEFPSLTNLQLGIRDTQGLELLADFFLHAPKLKSLCIYETSVEIPYETFLSAMPKRLPTCLSRSLIEIEFEVRDGDEDLLKVIEYFLENANLLQTIRIGFRLLKKPRPLLLKLQEMGRWWNFANLPTHSNMRQILWKDLLETTWTELI